MYNEIPLFIARVYLAKTNYDISNKDVYAKNGGTIQFTKLITDIANDTERNNLILDRLHKVEGSTIILSDRVSQLKYLCSHVENGVQIDGSTPKKVREKALDDVRCGRVKYLFASYQLAKEGLDCTILSNLVMASPVKDYTVVVQSIGRIMRPYEGKTVANVYDIGETGRYRNLGIARWHGEFLPSSTNPEEVELYNVRIIKEL